MTGKLRELLNRNVATPGLYPELEFDYTNGHDLSGVTHFRVDGAGRYQLSSNVTKGRQALSWKGVLGSSDRDALFATLEKHFLDVPSSTRNIGDDEVPILVTLRLGDLSHSLKIWHGDAVRNGDFHALETQLVALATRLSGGALLLTAD